MSETVEVEFSGKINLKIWPDEISKEIIHAKSMTEDTKSLFGLILDKKPFAACSSAKMNFNMKVAVIVLFITKATIRNSKQKQTYQIRKIIKTVLYPDWLCNITYVTKTEF